MKKKYLVSLVLVAIFSFSIFIAFAKTSRAEADNMENKNVVFENVEFSDVYAVGETINIPSISAVYNEISLDVYAVLQKDYKVISKLNTGTKNVRFNFTEEGQYTLIYTAKAGNHNFTKSFNFLVNNGSYFTAAFNKEYNIGNRIDISAEAVIGGNYYDAVIEIKTLDNEKIEFNNNIFIPSAIGEYFITYSASSSNETLTKTYKISIKKLSDITNMFETTNVDKITANVDSEPFARPGNGISFISNAKETTIKYKNIIDLNGISPTTNIIKLLPLGEDPSFTQSITELFVDIIDAHDSNNTISYSLKGYYATDPTKTSQESTYAYVLNNGKQVITPGGSNIGTIVTSVHFKPKLLEKLHQNGSRYGQSNWFYVQVDYEKKQFLASCSAPNYTLEPKVLFDGDDPNFVQSNVWPGFVNGEVYVQVRYQLAEDGKAGIIIDEIAGQSLSGETITDNTKPYVSLDENYSTRLPLAFVNKDYTIPAVLKITDIIDGEITYPFFNAKLYYLNEGAYFEKGYVDRTFQFTEPGLYKIEYEVEDSNGNIGKKRVDIEAIVQTEEASFITNLSDISVGSKIKLPKYSVNGVSYLVKEDVQIIYDGKDITDKIGKEIVLNANKPIIYNYDIEDFLGNKLKSQQIVNLGLENKTIIVLKDKIIDFAILDREFVLPDFTAINYSKEAGNADREPARSIKVNGRNIDLINRNVKALPGESVLEVEYAAGNTVEIYTILVKDNKKVSDRFVASSENDVEFANTVNGVKISFTSDTEIKAIFPFNFRVGTSFPVTFEIDKNNLNFRSFDIIYTDYFDQSKVVTVRFETDGTNLKYQINGRGPIDTIKPIDGNSNRYSIKLNNLAKLFEGLANISEFENGYKFTGFSELIDVSIKFNGITNQCNFLLSELGFAKLSTTFKDGNPVDYIDYSKPELVMKTDIFNKAFSINQPIELSSVFVLSSMSGFTTAKLNVYYENTLLYSNLNAYNDFTFIPTKYGNYRVDYISQRGDGFAMGVESFGIFIDKLNPHQVLFNMEVKDTYKINSKIKIPEISITDSLGEVNNTIYYTDGNGFMAEVKVNDVIVLNTLGTCKIAILSEDDFNAVYKLYEFVVTRD